MGTSCPHDPEEPLRTPLGMYHCPDCGAMVVAGVPHPSDEEVKEFQGITPYGDREKED